ncbi:hypothetical protein IMZ48_41965, partial [Candidatus Bathyarchaeota archaeon]|nr:hypothetical protein [Candidatus Bathyarchaeota archaeon]
GLIHLLTLSIGSILLPLVLLALGFLWKESMLATTGTDPRMPWIRILNNQWATSFVTIRTAIMRATIALQASSLTAMLASIILEAVGTPLSQAPFYSIVRALDASPRNLLSSAVLRPKTLLSSLVSTLIMIEILLTIASQFLSTILVSDFADGTFANMNNLTEVNTMGGFILTQTPWWVVPHTSIQAFAEISEPFTEGPDFHDTGHTYRAFLPFEEKAERTTLRHFQGHVPIMDQRVLCARPSLTNLTIRASQSIPLHLSGKITIDTDSYPMLQETRKQPELSFACELPSQWSKLGASEGESGGTSLCLANMGKNWTVLLEDTLVDPAFLTPEGSLPMGYVPEASTMFIVLDVLDIDAILVTYNALVQAPGTGLSVEIARNDGLWDILTGEEATEVLRATSCITNLGSQTFRAEMRSSRDPVEPEIPWDIGTTTYNIEAASRLLGASRKPEALEDRGVLKLSPKSQWQLLDLETDLHVWYFARSLFGSMLSSRNTEHDVDYGVVFCNSQTRAHGTHESLFQNTLHSTGSPALAFQAALARIHQMSYYEAFQQPNSTEASTSFSTSALIPSRWTGFIAAAVLTATHLTVVGIVTVLFLRSTSHSLLGNHWQVVSQVISEDTHPILEQADGMRDKDVKCWAKSQSVDMRSHAVLRYRGSGRVALSTEGLPRSHGQVGSRDMRTLGKYLPAGSQNSTVDVDGSYSDGIESQSRLGRTSGSRD